MNQQQLKEKIVQVIDENKVGILATVKGNKPHSRYMTFFNDNLTLYTPTNKETHKAEEVEENPNVHILLGYQGEGLDDEFVEVSGKVTIRDDQNLKEELWNERMGKWLDGPNDPEYVVLEIKPDHIRLMNSEGNPPLDLDL